MPSEHFLTYGDQQISYNVKVDSQRSSRIAIHVDPDGSVSVDVPPVFDEAAIRAAVQKRARWIVGHVAEARARFAHVRPREYVSGEQILYLGRRYVLKVLPTDSQPKPVRLKGNRLVVETKSSDPDIIRGKVRGWYKVKARDYFVRMIDEAATRLPWVNQAPPLRLLEMNKQWGSCSAGGKIILNPHLIKSPRVCIEYVVLHEIAHLKHHDHGPEFWRLVGESLPQWRVAKKTLDDMAEILLAE
ncbi:M48 family metallopeptidase [Roseovarius arcticus]|uniref:M48 family metallopeptidase n=1 Tax=Roseovarius arcticus TaxID=2547404 RepID=UPI001110E396|nr:SprT family zinc-dependent metalloprotease [Roseovarius arcticus]